jgi:hypothetical protein
MSHTASGTSFKSLDDLCNGLERLDKLRGLPYGGAAPTAKISPQGKSPQNQNGNNPQKKTTPVGFVSHVQGDGGVDSSSIEMHKDAWVGAINLSEEKVKLLRSIFKCVQCQTNDHTLPNCPLMKNWIVKKKPRDSNSSDPESQSRTVGGVSSVSASLESQTISAPSGENSRPLSPVLEEPEDNSEVNHTGNVEFNLLEEFGSLDVTSTSEIVLPYLPPIFKSPLGSVHSVSSSRITNEKSSTKNSFNLNVDSGCTWHMVPFRSAFITYRETPDSYVILADKSKVACSGLGTVQFSLKDKSIMLHDVLHVPKYSVCYFQFDVFKG